MKAFTFGKGRMRVKLRALLIFLLIFAVLFAAIPPAVSASAGSEADEEALAELEESIEELIDSLDLEELQAYLDSLAQFEGVSLKDKLMSVVTGDFALDYSSLAQSLAGLVWDEAQMLFPAFAVILAIAVLCGILNSVKNGFLDSSMTEIVNFVGYLSIGAIVLACLLTVLKAGFSALESMRTQMELVFPLLLTLMAGSGGTVSAAVYRPAVAFLSGALVELFTAIVLPSALVIIVLSFVGKLSDEVRTERLGELFKSVNKWLIGISLTLFSLFLTVQGITSATYDGISLRAAKYAITNSVPIVGGFLSGGVDLVLAGSALIKNALGSFSIFMLVGTLFRPLVLFVVFHLFLRLAAAATEPIGGKISSFLSALAGDFNYFTAGLLAVSFLYFITVLLLVCSSGVMF